MAGVAKRPDNPRKQKKQDQGIQALLSDQKLTKASLGRGHLNTDLNEERGIGHYSGE